MSKSPQQIGLISDTHGLIRPEALKALRKSDIIIHCGDIGDRAVLDALEDVAPVRAVKGNNDRGSWARALPKYDVVEIDHQRIYVVHELADIPRSQDLCGFTAVAYGHSHEPTVETRNGLLFVNPGSAGPRRFRLPTTVAELRLRSHGLTARIIDLRIGHTK